MVTRQTGNTVESSPGVRRRSGGWKETPALHDDSSVLGGPRTGQAPSTTRETPGRVNKHVILVIEDEKTVRRLIQSVLENTGHKLIEAETGPEGLALASSHRPDLILLDWGLQGLAGWLVLKRLREWTRVPILVLSTHSTEMERIEALDAGADDFLAMPFGAGEFSARIRTALRHLHRMDQPGDEPVFETPDFSVDLARRTVTAGKKEVRLTYTEYRLLAMLVRNAGNVATQEQLKRENWGVNNPTQENCLRVYVHQLRQKLEPDPAKPRYILTEPGVGYRLKTE